MLNQVDPVKKDSLFLNWQLYGVDYTFDAVTSNITITAKWGVKEEIDLDIPIINVSTITNKRQILTNDNNTFSEDIRFYVRKPVDVKYKDDKSITITNFLPKDIHNIYIQLTINLNGEEVTFNLLKLDKIGGHQQIDVEYPFIKGEKNIKI